MVVNLECAEIIQGWIIAENPQSILIQALVLEKEMTQHEKENIGKHRRVKKLPDTANCVICTECSLPSDYEPSSYIALR